MGIEHINVDILQYTQETAQQHGCVGWVQNTGRGTVVGCVQGPEKEVDFM